jgi:hypothetical protein
MRIRRTPLTLCLVLVAASASAAVRVPRAVAPVAVPPPHSRACVVSFGGLRPVGTTCAVPAYSEAWDGPLLVASNSGRRTLWVSYVFEAADGATYRSACFELAAGETFVIDETAMEPTRPRQVVIAQLPGPGYPANGLLPGCTESRTRADVDSEGE